MNQGRPHRVTTVVEKASSKELYSNPKHPYTLSLLSAVPEPNPRPSKQRIVLKGDIPVAGDGWYFKAGTYTQSNVERGDAPDAAGQVVIYSLGVTHSP